MSGNECPGLVIRLVPVGQLAWRDRRSILEALVRWGEGGNTLAIYLSRRRWVVCLLAGR